jgi:8-oxo-dGTP pyrophosphatase MutT (NUDIX family)
MADLGSKLQTRLRELTVLRKLKVFAFSNDIDFTIKVKSLRKAAVLFLVCFIDGKPHVLLTKRSSTVIRSRGEVCLPGGHLEEGETLTNAALRETREEVGISEENVTVVGSLPPSLHRGLYTITVTPIVGILHPDCDPHQLKLCPHEVESAFWTPLELFLSTSSHEQSAWHHPSQPEAYTVDWFEYEDHISNVSYWIWGFTSKVCILASSLFLDQTPAFPYTYLYHHTSKEENDIVLLTMKPLSLKFKSVL